MVLIWKRVKKFKLDSRRRHLSFSSFHSNRQWSVGTTFMQAYQTYSVHCSILMFSQPPLPLCGKEEKTLKNTYKCVPCLFRLFQFSFLDSKNTIFSLFFGTCPLYQLHGASLFWPVCHHGLNSCFPAYYEVCLGQSLLANFPYFWLKFCCNHRFHWVDVTFG